VEIVSGGNIGRLAETYSNIAKRIVPGKERLIDCKRGRILGDRFSVPTIKRLHLRARSRCASDLNFEKMAVAAAAPIKKYLSTHPNQILLPVRGSGAAWSIACIAIQKQTAAIFGMSDGPVTIVLPDTDNPDDPLAKCDRHDFPERK
jgi:hypothetical protein